MYPKYEWRTLPGNEEAALEVAKALNISPLAASLMAGRGILSAEDADVFLKGSFEHTHDPMLLHGMDTAVPRIHRALEEREHILIYGDYDADGVSSTTLMIQLMRYLGASYDIYIPHRSNEGYGLHNHALDWAHQQGVTLVITVDTGISAVEQIAYANALGMDVIVTDHHEPPETLPDAYSLINPKLSVCPYPFKGLAGVGVAYKLAQALVKSPPAEWLEIVAIGTIADLMPLHDENRILVKEGLQSMRHTRYEGVRALLEVSGVHVDQVTAVHIAFSVAPRINASGRMDHAGRAVTLLTTEQREDAERLAWELDALNKSRQQTVELIVQEAMGMILNRWGADQLPPVLIAAGEGWNVGVVGIVASKILERFYRPVIILGIDPDTGTCKGSARSIPGLDIYEALHSCRQTMDHFGGHPAAAGMSLHRDKLQEFEESLCRFADTVLQEEHFVPVQEADLECCIRDVTLESLDALELLGPFGMGNAVPKIIFRNLEVKEARKMGKDSRHLKLRMQQNSDTLEGVAFGYGHLADVLPAGTRLDVLGEMSVNEWNGNRKPQLMIHDMSVPENQVFDYRGIKDPLREITRLRESLEPHLRCAESRTAVICADNRLQEVKTHLPGLALWVYDMSAGILPANDRAEQAETGQISVLFIVDLPEMPSQMDELMSQFRQVPNIFLLHPARDQRERLQIPTREQFKTLYTVLARTGAESVARSDIIARMRKQSGLSVRMLSKVLNVFEELSFIKVSGDMISFVPNPDKKPLDASSHFRELASMAEMEQHLLFGNTTQVMDWMKNRSQGVS
nr:single-stranded-DNA-specific exonuclease RecJ [Paenibacillus lemnae]